MTSTMLFELPTPGKFQLILVVILCIGAFAYLFEYLTQRRESPEHLDRITQFDNCEDVHLDIVFVHGLGAHPYYTWTANGPRPGPMPKSTPNGSSTESEMKINWLEHDDFLKKDFKNARILSFGYNADWFMDASLSTAPQKALTFLRTLSKFRQETKRTPPIIFIGHSFGGILIKYAIHEAYSNTEFTDVTVNTAGILFLGTPHQGSPVSRIGEIFARLTSFSGSDAALLKLLRHHSPALLDLKRDFSKAWEHMRGSQRPLKIYSFYETKPTFKFGVSLGTIVDAHSATLDIGESISVNTNHSGLNKCKTEKDELYVKICDAIKGVQANFEKAIEPIAKWVTGSGDAWKHQKDHKSARDKLSRYRNIGEWLIGSPSFQSWSSFSESSKRTLWLRGGVGTGKTSVTSEVIEWFGKDSHLKGSQRLIYIYCSENHPVDSILRSIILQLAIPADGGPIHPLIANKYYSRDSRDRLPLDEGDHKLISQLCDAYTETVIVIDALDECPDPLGLISILQNAQKTTSGSIRLFLSSRLHVAVGDILSSYHSVDINEYLVSADMERYVETEVNSHYVGKYKSDQGLENLMGRLKNALFKHADGMFRWIELQIDMVFFDEASLDSLKMNIKKHLESLESGTSATKNHKTRLDEVYSSMLQIRHKYCDGALTFAIRWVLYSAWPLSTDTFIEAVKISHERVLTRTKPQQKAEPIDETQIICLCSNLITMGKDFKYVRFSHHSVKEYLLDSKYCQYDFSSETCHTFIAEICLWQKYHKKAASSTLEEYIYTNTLFHCSCAGIENRRKGELRELLHVFFQQPSLFFIFERRPRPYLSQIRGINHGTTDVTEECIRPIISVFMVACVFNLNEILELGWSLDTAKMDDPAAQQHLRTRGLMAACKYDCYEVVENLLNHSGRATKVTVGLMKHAASCSSERIVACILENSKHLNKKSMARQMMQWAAANPLGPGALKTIKSHYKKLPEDLDSYRKLIFSWGVNKATTLASLLEINNLFITDEIVGMALAKDNEKTISAILESGADIPITEHLLIKAASNFYHGGWTTKALVEHAKKKTGENIQLTDNVLRTVVSNRRSGRGILEYLFKEFGNDIKISEDMLYTAAKTDRYGYFKVLFEYRPEIAITEDLMLAFSGNAFLDRIIELLLNHNPTIPLTEDILVAIARNPWGGSEALEYLIEKAPSIRVTSQVVAAAAAETDKHTKEIFLSYLLDKFPNIRIDESILEAAASNEIEGNTLIRVLLYRDPSVQIGDRVIEAAASNLRQGNELIQTLLNHNNGLSIGDNIVQTAAGNVKTGGEVLEIIFQHAPNTKVSKAALEEAARNGNGRGLAVLLGRMDESEITDTLLEHLLEIAVCAVNDVHPDTEAVRLILDRSNTNHPISDAIMKAAVCRYRGFRETNAPTQLLLESGRPFMITEELLEVAALEATDDRVLRWLLEHEENLPVTKNIVIAAIENEYTDKLAMKRLLDRANINITRDMLKRAAELDGSYPYGWSRGEGKAPRQLTRLLLQYQDNLDVNEVLETATRNERFEKFMFLDLLEWRKNPEITEVVLVAAAQSTGEVMEAILEYKPDIQITQEVLKLVASNERWKMFSIMQIIFHYQRNIEITEDVMEAARNNKTMGRDLTALLRKHQGSCTLSSSTQQRIR